MVLDILLLICLSILFFLMHVGLTCCTTFTFYNVFISPSPPFKCPPTCLLPEFLASELLLFDCKSLKGVDDAPSFFIYFCDFVFDLIDIDASF